MPASQAYRSLWNDPAISARIDGGIERHRKGDAAIEVRDAEGRPLAGVPITVEQRTSAFHFGANLFMLDGYPTPELNARYESAYLALFNAATVPFYWKTLELEPGKPRYAADSPAVRRRPPPDRVVAFCEAHGLKMHGHTLVWDFAKWSVPDWLPDDPAESAPLWENRVREIAIRYGHRIKRWDVVNEVVPRRGVPLSRPMPDDYERLAFVWAERHFPRDARLDINEVTGAWGGHRAAYYELIRRLMDDGARVGGIGLQFHLFTDEDLASLLAGETFRPGDLLDALETFAAFGLPLHVSEITLTAPGNTESGQAVQAEVARDLYRLWFSHPAVDSITWWNVPDGGAAEGEDTVFSGLLNGDLTPKPAYHALLDLIHREWRTKAAGATDENGCFRFRGFHGTYSATVVAENGAPSTTDIQLHPAETPTLQTISL